jgi:hypothetical protein
MPALRYPRPPIVLVGLFCAPAAEPAPLIPPWWPNDKQRVASFQPPLVAGAEEKEDWR